MQNLDLLTSEGKYNYNAFLLADENTVSIKLVRYLGTNKLELLENLEFGNRYEKVYCYISFKNYLLFNHSVNSFKVYIFWIFIIHKILQKNYK